MRIMGFTGSQSGMTDAQRSAFNRMVNAVQPLQFHHRDCVGACATAAVLARMAGCRIISHPPTENSKRAFFRSDYEFEPLPCMESIQRIVDACEILVATPSGAEEARPKSETWETVRRARKAGKPVRIINPDGTTSY